MRSTTIFAPAADVHEIATAFLLAVETVSAVGAAGAEWFVIGETVRLGSTATSKVSNNTRDSPIIKLSERLFGSRISAKLTGTSSLACQSQTGQMMPNPFSLRPIIAITLATALCAAAASAQSDDFNRPNAATLGPNWVQQAGTSSILNNRATGTDQSLATFVGGSGNTVSFDLFSGGSSLQYGAGILGFGGSDFFFVKVQNSGSTGNFDTFGFYRGNNGAFSFDQFALLTSNFNSAHVVVSRVGSVATLFITPNVGATQSYSFDYGTGPSGTGTGLGFYGAAQIDNFSSGASTTVTPEPSTYALMAAGLLSLAAVSRRRRSSTKA